MNSKCPHRTRVVILGHSGFIGMALMRHLEAEGACEVIGRSAPGIDLRESGSVALIEHLLTPDTVVVMCAAIKRQAGDTLENCRQNILMALNLAQTVTVRPVRRLIFMSSAAVYGEDISNSAITEHTPPCVRSYYGLAKISAELILTKVMTDTGGTVVHLRPPTIYGAFEESPSYGVGSFLRQAMAGEAITLWGDGNELRGMVFIDDVVALLARLLDSPYAGSLNLASSRSYSFREALDAVKAAIGRPVVTTTRNRSKQKVDNIFGEGKLKTLMPDFVFTDLMTGVRLTYEREYKGRV